LDVSTLLDFANHRRRQKCLPKWLFRGQGIRELHDCLAAECQMAFREISIAWVLVEFEGGTSKPSISNNALAMQSSAPRQVKFRHSYAGICQGRHVGL
jgi:hypothetical protein